jgi:hypothetical protein
MMPMMESLLDTFEWLRNHWLRNHWLRNKTLRNRRRKHRIMIYDLYQSENQNISQHNGQIDLNSH